MTLTAQRILLRKRAEEILSMADKTLAKFISMESMVARDIYIGGGKTEAIKLIAQLAKDLQKDYPDIHYHLYSGNFEDVTEPLDKELLDFGILIQKEVIRKEDLLDAPLIFSRQAMIQDQSGNEVAKWFGEDFDKLNIVTTFNLVYNAAIMVEAGIGYALTIDKIANTTESSNLCFRPLELRLDSGLDIVWKKYQVFSPAAELFLKRLEETFLPVLV